MARLSPRRATDDNLEALEALAAAQRDGRDLTADEWVLVQRWHGWGAAPQFFDRPEFTAERARLRELVGDAGVAAAARTTLNAHYTDAILVDAMWKTVGDLGLPGGVFLEAGCGRGTFLSRAPAAWSGLGVELDPTTARVARALVDRRHQVLTADFATVPVAPGRAGAVIGNVPFGSMRLFDPTHNPGRHLPIHDHFIAKASSTLAPGGIAVVLTSRYTLDKLDDTGRQAIGAHADFLGAVRLPSTAHQAEAGTSVVTDMVVLRGRADGERASHAPGWDEPPVTITEWDGQALAEPTRISGYYAAHRQQVLGRIELDHAMFALDMVVRPTGDLADQLARGLAAVVAANRGGGRPGPIGAAQPQDLLAAVAAGPPAPVGRIERDGIGFRRSGLTAWEDHHPPSTNRVELRWLIDLRDHADSLVATEAEPTVADDDLAAQRSALAAEHARYVRQFGPVNRVKVNPDTGHRTYPQMGGFRKDPGFPRVAALELYDEALNSAEPAALLRGRVVKAAVAVERADTAADAFALSLQQRGRVDMAYIAALLDTSEDEAVAALGDRIFEDPEQRVWVSSQEYLSGNVRAKLAAAVAMAENRPELAVNVAALREVQPVDVVATDLQGTLGAPWVDERYVTAFARSLSPARAEIRASIQVARAQTTGQWEVSASTEAKAGMRVGHAYGGERFDALRVLQDRLNGRPSVITHTNSDGKSVVDAEATAAAEEKAESMSDAFDHWLLTEDQDRARHVLERYNNQFNSFVARSYAGMHVDPPGLRASFQLRPHQHQAVARIVHGGNTLLAHPVGAGKTAEMIVGAMELRRLGVVRLPAFVVPNHMLAQFSRDVVDLYPAAAVLTLDSGDLNDKGRALFAARVQSNDWDAIVMTHNSFGAWPMSPDAHATELHTRLAALRADIARMAGADIGATLTKKLEKKLVNDEERLKAVTAEAAARQDEHPFYFDHPGGVDWVAIDEAQEFKNAELVSSARNIRGVPTGEGAQKAQDLAMKLRYLQRSHPDHPVVTFATGTPVSNTAAEIWVMARYLRPDLCERLGVSNFDDFRAQFCDTTSAMELDASGTKMKRIERLAKYKNLPELARMVGEFADVVRVEDLGLPRPELVGGAREIVVIEPDPGLVDFMANTVAARADDIHHRRVKPEEDNNLKLTTHCRLASFDWAAFSGQEIDERHSMLATAANRIAKTYHAHAGDAFLTPSGGVHPRPGSLQLVFSDLGTPHEDRNDTAYDRLRAMLVARGVPDAQIGFVHHYDNSDESKARFFEMCRDGRISVAMSSTAKMGIGTNVQDRLYAIHHLDVPWRPDFIEQREGRGLRQGNQHPRIEIIAYATERSFSATGWQTVQRKAGFVGQLMRADPDGPRTLEAVDEQTLSYGQIKAMATGDPAFLEMADLDDRIARLSRLERAHSQEIAALARRQRNLTEQIQVTAATLEALRPLAARVARRDPAAPWRVEIAGVEYKNRAEAARALDRYLPRYGASRPLRFVDAAIEYGWRAGTSRDEPGRLELLTAPAPGVRPPVVVVDDRTEPGLMGALTRCTNQVEGLPLKVQAGEVKLGELHSQMAQVQGADRSEFPRREELVAARHRLVELSALLAERYAPPPPVSDETSPPAPNDGPGKPERPIPAPVERTVDTAHLGGIGPAADTPVQRYGRGGTPADVDGAAVPTEGSDAVSTRFTVRLPSAAQHLEPVTVELRELTAANPVEVLSALESRIGTIAETAVNYRAEESALRNQGARIGARVGQPFGHQARLDTVGGRLRDIEDLLEPPETAGVPAASAMASIRRLPRRPRPDDPVSVTDYDDCPICLSSDLRSSGDGVDQVRCKECGWFGSYPRHPHLRVVEGDRPAAGEVDVDPAPPVPGAVGDIAERVEPSASTTATVPGTRSITEAAATRTELLAPDAATSRLPSIHQQHQLHQQLYPAPRDPGPIIQA